MNKPAAPRPLPSQTLLRGLGIVDAVASGVTLLPDISRTLSLSPSTTHRIASALVQAGYLRFEPRKGYSLGYRLLELGFLAYRQLDLPSRARPHLEALAAQTQDTVHLAILADEHVVYLDKLDGRRAVQISSSIGGHKRVLTTGVGKALLLDVPAEEWLRYYRQSHLPAAREQDWLKLMEAYAAGGYAFDLGEDEPSIRCVAAPIRDAGQRIVAAISVSSAQQYMDDARMQELIAVVQDYAGRISHEFGGRLQSRA